MRAIGFNGGQFGDVIMGLVAARAHKEQFPNSKLTIAAAEKYSAVLPLLRDNPLVDGTYSWKGYNDWPLADDNLHLITARYDKVYNAMPQHTEPFWYLHRHQTEELCLMHGLTPPENIQVSLKPVCCSSFVKSPSIALCLFGETRGGEKSPSIEQAKEIVELVKKMGYTPIQFGLASEPQICEQRFVGTFLESVIEITSGCKALITVDTAMAWIVSGYSFPTVGLYGFSYYPLATTAKNWQPVNPNAIYLESPKVTDIIIDRVEAAIKTLKC